MNELKKNIHDLKMGKERKNTKRDKQEIENIGKKSGVIDTSTTYSIQEMEERISGSEDTIENINTTVKEIAKFKMLLTQYIQEIQDKMQRPNLGNKKSEDSQLKGQ